MPLIGNLRPDRFPKEDVRIRRSLGRPIYVPYLGAAYDVDLGAHSLSGTFINLTNEIAGVKFNGTTVLACPEALYSVAIGKDSGIDTLTTGYGHTLIGNWTGQTLTTQTFNVFIGFAAGKDSTSSQGMFLGALAGQYDAGTFNTYIGHNTGTGNSGSPHTGQDNVGIGSSAMLDIQSDADYNICLGLAAGYHVSGDSNICIGGGSGYLPNPFSGNYNILIGDDCSPDTAYGAIVSSICIGASCRPTASHICMIGSNSGDGYIDNFYLGSGIITGSTRDTVIQVAGGDGSNVQSGDLILAAGKSTGNATPSSLLFKTGTIGSSGSTPQTLATRFIVSSTLVSSNEKFYAAGEIELDGALNHDGTSLGFFGTAPTTQTTVSDQATWADIATGVDLVDRADLNTKVKAIRDKLQVVIDALQSYGLI